MVVFSCVLVELRKLITDKSALLRETLAEQNTPFAKKKTVSILTVIDNLLS